MRKIKNENQNVLSKNEMQLVRRDIKKSTAWKYLSHMQSRLYERGKRCLMTCYVSIAQRVQKANQSTKASEDFQGLK